MTRRRKIILSIIAALLLLALALLGAYLFLRKPTPAPTVPTPVAAAPTSPLKSSGSVPITPLTDPVVIAPPLTPPTPDALRTAEVFAARFGSYSNQERSYQNLIDLMPIMTTRYRTQTEAITATAAAGSPAASYQGTTSVKVSSRELSDDGSKATADVNLQQTKTDSAGSNVTYRVLRLMLAKAGEDWQVDSVQWIN